MSHSCENYDTSDPTVLTIEGIYKHGENQALNVSQQVTFRNIVRDNSGNITSQDVIPLQRNHLYNVVLTPKYDNGALVFDKIDYTIQVVDWKNGETIVFAGDANLTKQSTPSFTVTGAHSILGAESDGKTNPTLIYTGIDDHSVYLTVTSNTTGTMLECSTFPSTQYGLVSSSTTNDADGNLVETYKIDIDDNIAIETDYTFTLSNAINTSLSRTFVLKKRPKLPIEYFAAGNVRAANNAGVWSFSMDPARTQITHNGYSSFADATGHNITSFLWNNTNSGDNVMCEPLKSMRDGITFTNVPNQEYRLPSAYEWAIVAPSNLNGRFFNMGSSYTTTGFSEQVPIAYPSTTLYNVTSYYTTSGYNTYNAKAYAIRFECADNNNLYRCAYRYSIEQIGNTDYMYYIIDVKYVGVDNSITLQYIQDNEATYWAVPDATLIIPTCNDGGQHYWTSTQYSVEKATSFIADGTRYLNANIGNDGYTYGKSQWWFYARLIEKH